MNLSTDTTNNCIYVGLFSQVAGTVENLTIEGRITVGLYNKYVGGICGKL